MKYTAAILGLVFLCAAISGCAMFSRTRAPRPRYLECSQMRGWDIVVDENAIPSEQYAAEEFKQFFMQATGIDLPIRADTRSPSGHVYIGSGAAFERSGCAFDTGAMGEEELRFIVKTDQIAIAGGRPRGTLYGVYQFLEDLAGVRFLTYDHTYVPTNPALKIKCADFSYSPPFSFRWSYYRQNADHPEFAARLRVNTVTPDEKFGGNTRQRLIGHTLYNQLPVAEYGKDHPEYYALVDGERKLDVGGGGPQPCVTNPDVITIVAEAVIRELDANPTVQNVSVSQNDNDLYCRCQQCEQINKREGTPMGSHLAFVNAVAERVEKKYPNVKIGTLAYWYTRKPPKTIVPRHNVQIQLCSIECCTLHPIDDPQCLRNRDFCEDMTNWGNICNDIWIWNYNTNFSSYDLPFPNLRSIGPNVRYFLRNKAKGVFMQANGNGNAGELCDLRNYIIARMIWNPSLDARALCDEFINRHYQSAAKPIGEYLKMLHDNAERSGQHPRCFPTPEQVGLRPKIAQRAFGYFEKAVARADDDTVRARVEKASICAYKAMIEAGGHVEYRDGMLRPNLPQKYDRIIDQYIALCNKYDMDQAAETMPAQDYFDQIRKGAVGLPAIRLENAIWRMTIVPAVNGKVVELIYRPTGRNLCKALSPQQYGIYLRRGTFEEEGEIGYDHKSPAEFTSKIEGSTVTLTKTLADGPTIVRLIALREDHPERIYCESTITHNGTEPKEYQIKVHPEFDVVTPTRNADIISGYVLNGRWAKFNDEWEIYTGPNAELLKNARGGAFAFFNHRVGFGMLERYRPEQLDSPRFWWHPDWPQVNLELFTRKVFLNKDESFSYQYEFEYLSAPPE